MKLKKTWLIMTWRTWTIPAILLKLNLLKNGNKVLFTLLKNLPKDSVKHLGIKFNYNFTWHHQINNANGKLNRANDMLSKIRYLMNFRTLRSIYHVIFYCYNKLLVCAPYINSRCLVIAKTTRRIMHVGAEMQKLVISLNI